MATKSYQTISFELLPDQALAQPITLNIPVPHANLTGPTAADPAGWYIHLPGAQPLVGGQDFIVAIKPVKDSRNTSLTIDLKAHAYRGHADKLVEPVLLQYQETDNRRYRQHFDAKAEEFNDFREMAWEIFGRPGIEPDQDRFWQLVQQALVRWFDPQLWWAQPASITAELQHEKLESGVWYSFVSPYTEADVKKLAEKISTPNSNETAAHRMLTLTDTETTGEFLLELNTNLDVDTRKNSSLPRKISFKFYLLLKQESYSTRDALSLIGLIEDLSRIFISLLPSSESENSQAAKNAIDTFLRLLFGIRNNIFLSLRNADELVDIADANMVVDTVAQHPPALAFIMLDTSDMVSFRYVLDMEQIETAQDVFNTLPGDSLNTRLDNLLPKPLIQHLEKCRLPCVYFEGDPAFSADFKNLFSPTGYLDRVCFYPLIGQNPSQQHKRVTMIVQVAWPRIGDNPDYEERLMPLIPEFQQALMQTIFAQESNILQSYLTEQFSKRHAKFEFVRSISWFLGHNLPKTTVTPLYSLAAELKYKPLDTYQPQTVAQQLEVVANLLSLQLHALDIFKVRHTNAIALSPVALTDVLQDVQAIFEFLKLDRSKINNEFANIVHHVNLQISAEPIVIQGYMPAIFHSIYVPVENALRHLNPKSIAKSPKKGVITIQGKSVGSGYALLIRDQGLGMTADRLQEVQTWLDEACANAKNGAVLPFNRVGKHASGQNIGLGLVLVGYFMGLLKNSSGQTGHISIQSEPGKGTEVTVFYPDNSGQKEILLGE